MSDHSRFADSSLRHQDLLFQGCSDIVLLSEMLPFPFSSGILDVACHRLAWLARQAQSQGARVWLVPNKSLPDRLKFLPTGAVPPAPLHEDVLNALTQTGKTSMSSGFSVEDMDHNLRQWTTRKLPNGRRPDLITLVTFQTNLEPSVRQLTQLWANRRPHWALTSLPVLMVTPPEHDMSLSLREAWDLLAKQVSQRGASTPIDALQAEMERRELLAYTTRLSHRPGDPTSTRPAPRL